MSESHILRRGAAYDDRIKPDVIAPGEWVLSAYSSDTPDDSDSMWCGLEFYSGTSMATPIVAGVLAQMRQHFMQGCDGNNDDDGGG